MADAIDLTLKFLERSLRRVQVHDVLTLEGKTSVEISPGAGDKSFLLPYTPQGFSLGGFELQGLEEMSSVTGWMGADVTPSTGLRLVRFLRVQEWRLIRAEVSLAPLIDELTKEALLEAVAKAEAGEAVFWPERAGVDG